MPKKETGENKDHFINKIDAAQVLAKFLRLQFKLFGVANKTRNIAADVFGAARKEDFDKLAEEIDRVAGKLNEQKEKQ